MNPALATGRRLASISISISTKASERKDTSGYLLTFPPRPMALMLSIVCRGGDDMI
jgi:hypothetical protein